MSIGSVMINSVASTGGQMRPERQDMMALQKALRSDDLAGAKQAFAQFKTDFHAAHQGRALFQTGIPDTLKQDLQGLQSALRSGDLAGAQQAFAQFKTDFKSLQGPPKEPPQPAPGPSPTATGSGLNVLA